MKQIKVLSILLCAALVFSLMGCNRQPEPTAATPQETTVEITLETTVETTDATEPEYIDTTVAYHAPMSAVSMPVLTASSQADDGTTLFTYTYQGLSLFLQEAPVADAIFLDYQNRLDSLHATARDLHTAATAAYTGQDGWEPYSLQVQYLPMRFDEMVLSFYASKTIYDGSFRGNYTNFFLTYDLLTGRALEIRDILVADYSADDLVELIVQDLSKYEEDKMLFPDYAQLVSDMFQSNRPVDNWYFAQDGLCFFFKPYEIAPNSAGIIISKIPYDALGGLLKDNYFPAETINFAGTPKVVPFSEANTENLGNFAELVLDTSGEEVLLYADGTVLNVRIATGTKTEDGLAFSTGSTVFAASSLSKGDAVLIQRNCDLLLSYESNGIVGFEILPGK